MCEKFLSLPNDSVSVCVKGKIINRKVGYRLETSAEYIYVFYVSEKTIQWAKRTLDAVNGNVKKKFEDV